MPILKLMRLAALGGLTLFALPSVAHADAVVNLCTADTQAGMGVNLAKALVGGGHITFSCPAGSVIVINAPRIISLNTQIDGAGSITLDARGLTAMFALNTNSPALTLTGLTLRGGIPRTGPIGGVVAPGGVVSGQGTVVINNSTITGNNSPINMGGGQVTIAGSTLSNNSLIAIHAPSISLTNSKIQTVSGTPMLSSGGRVTIDHSVVTGGGGSTFDACILTISGSQFVAASTSAVISGCDTFISTSKFTNNHGANGAGLYLAKSANSLSISGSAFSGNVATAQGGAIAFEPSTVTPRSLQLSNVTFEGNAAQTGGAINLGSFLENNNTLLGSALIFSGNSASKSGGAVAGTNAQLALTRAVFINNSAAQNGGAIDSLVYGLRPSVIANSLFAGNAAPGGSAFHGSAVQLINVTFADNLSGPAISPFWPSPVAVKPDASLLITLHNVAFSKNAAGGCAPGLSAALFNDAGQNLQFPAAGCAASILVADPGFDSMFVPASNGPAFGTGDLAACRASPVSGVDLFGLHRPQGKSCSIGAVEGDLQSAIKQQNPKMGSVPNPPSCPCGPSSGPGSASSSPLATTVTSVPLAPPPTPSSPSAPPSVNPYKPPSGIPYPRPSTSQPPQTSPQE